MWDNDGNFGGALAWRKPRRLATERNTGRTRRHSCCSEIWTKNVVRSVGILYDTICTTSCRLRLKCDGTRAETRFRLSAKRTSLIKSVGASVRSTTGRQGVRISGSNAGYAMFRGSVKGIGCTLPSPVSPSLPLPCVTVCHHISTGLTLTLKNVRFIHPHSTCMWFSVQAALLSVNSCNWWIFVPDVDCVLCGEYVQYILFECSARRRDLYLTTHDTHNRQISMPPVGFEPTISAGWFQTQATSSTWRGSSVL